MSMSYPTVHGNLALKPVEPVSRFTVINGSAAAPHLEHVQAPSCPHLHLPRILAVAIAIGIVVSCIFTAYTVLQSEQTAYHAAVTSEQLEAVTVAPGDSLWSIAAAHPLEGLDTAAVADAIQAINALESGTLQPGMVLNVPVS